ncbi:hypothetical protein [Agreia pratensis]|uniref:hypothetical protein n=1 Tax=Agreia pratensis TaxID=150121 RepID=UPI00188BE51F|nr:hypothetical protein [Agreia pratensis]
MSGLSSVPGSFGEARSWLLPRVYGAAHASIEYLELVNYKAESGYPALQPVTRDLQLGVSVELESGYAKVSAATLSQWGVTLEQALDGAVENSLDRELDLALLAEGTFLINDEKYAAVWRRPVLAESLPIAGAPIVLAATASVTVVCGEDSPDGLLVMAATLEQVLRSGERVESITPQRWDGNSWTAVEWPVEVVRNGTAGVISRLFAAGLYSRQRPALGGVYKGQGHDVYVADYQLVKNPEGQMLSIASWTEGAWIALPIVDEIVLVKPGGETVGVAWDRAQAVFGSLLKPATTNPERYVTQGFPSQDQVRQALG